MNELLLPITIGLTDEKKIEIQTSTGHYVSITFFYLDYKSRWQIDNGMRLTQSQAESLISSLQRTIETMKLLRGEPIEEPKKKKKKRSKASKKPVSLVSIFCPDSDVSEQETTD